MQFMENQNDKVYRMILLLTGVCSGTKRMKPVATMIGLDADANP